MTDHTETHHTEPHDAKTTDAKTSDAKTHDTGLTTAEQTAADQQAVADVLARAHVAVVTTITADGSLVSRPLALLDRPFDGELFFFTPDPSDKTDQVRAHEQVNVAVHHDGNHLSIAGSAIVTQDQQLIDELWNPAVAAWFEGGPEDESVALLRVTASSAELIALDGPRPIAMLRYAKAMVSGDQPDIADSTRVEF